MQSRQQQAQQVINNTLPWLHNAPIQGIEVMGKGKNLLMVKTFR